MSNPPQRPGGVTTDHSDSANNQGYSLDSLTTEEFLRVVGLRVRTKRAAMSMSRKRLAEVSGVSERYLAQLESGQGNMSIALLRKVTAAIDMPLATLLAAETPELSAHENIDVVATQHRILGSDRTAYHPGAERSGSNAKLVT